MAIELKYGKLDIPGIPDDEPVFVLRGQDQLAVRTIQHYATLVRTNPATESSSALAKANDFADQVMKAVELFKRWEPKKLPD